MVRWTLTAACWFFTMNGAWSQACSASSAPVVLGGIQGHDWEDEGLQTWRVALSLSYDWNQMERLIQNSESLTENFRERSNHITSLQLNVILRNTWTFTFVLPFVSRHEQNNAPGQQEFVQSTSGIGDGMMAIGHRLKWRPDLNQFLAVGLKLPTGDHQLVHPTWRVPFSADLQPGTGSVDYLALTELDWRLKEQWTFALRFMYSLNTQSRRFDNWQPYEFGDSWQLNVIGKYHVLRSRMWLSGEMLFLNMGRDQINSGIVPNSGGNWYLVGSGVGGTIGNNLDINGLVYIPVHEDVVGVQLSTTYRVRCTVEYNF